MELYKTKSIYFINFIKFIVILSKRDTTKIILPITKFFMYNLYLDINFKLYFS